MTTRQEAQPQDAAVDRSLAGQGAPGQDPQGAAGAEGHQPGAEQQAVAPKERTYTQAEWSARESAKDKENAQLRRQLIERDAREHQNQVVMAEREARAADARAVEDGEITEAEAATRTQRRGQYAREESQRQRERGAHQQMLAQGEQVGRVLAANDLATEFGLKVDDLMKDDDLSNYTEMREKAWQLYKTKMDADKKGTEKFDSAQVTPSKGAKSYIDRLRTGEALPSAAEIDRLTAKYLK